MQRYFINELKDNKFFLNDKDTYHCKKVMRSKKGDNLEIVYNNELYLGSIISLNNKVSGTISTKLESKKVLYNVTIAQGLVVENKFNLIIQKSVELGAKEIIPLKCERSIIKVNKDFSSKQTRWQQIANDASSQSKRLDIPQVSKIMSINDLKNTEYKHKFLCSVNENSKTIKMVLQNTNICDKMLFVVGPEGGFTNSEEQVLIDNGFERISLGSLVLRTETASIAILSMINFYFME